MTEEKENDLSKQLNQIQSFQTLFLSYFDSEEEKGFENLNCFLKDHEILENKQKFFTNLCFFSKITKNHHRFHNFSDKVNNILNIYQPFFSKHCKNDEIFNIFRRNKLILLLLFNKKILKPTEEIYSIISTEPYKKLNYIEYFDQEFKEFNKLTETIQSDDKKRLSGENDNLICTLIQNDNLEEFIKYVNQMNINLTSKIQSSIYETNSYLIGKTPSIIEYATFHGSIGIVRYILCNGVTFSEGIWEYAVHSNNSELINLIEEKSIQPPNNSFDNVLLEAIKCHHNDLAEYIQNNKYTTIGDELKKSILVQSARFHNYGYIENDYNTLTGNRQFMVLLSKERYYELLHVLLSMRVGPGILCSCIDANFGENSLSSLNCAIENNDIEMIKVLMSSETFNPFSDSKRIRKQVEDEEERQFTEYNDTKTSFYLIVERQYYDIMELLLSSGKDCSWIVNKESTLICINSEYNEVVTNKIVEMPIHLAIKKGDNKMLELLLRCDKININVEAKYSKEIKKPFYFNSNQIEKKTPLQVAVETENEKAVQLLLSQKTINVNKKYHFKLDKALDGFEYDEDNQGNEEEEFKNDNERDKQVRLKKMAIHIAVEKNNLNIVSLLLKYEKIDVNSREEYKLIKPLLKINLQRTALQIAIENKNIEIVDLLLKQRSISINERIPYMLNREPKTIHTYYNDEGEEHEIEQKPAVSIDCLRTPLHVAVQTGCIEIIKLLLQQKSIDTKISDGQGKLPIDYTDNNNIKALFPK